MHSFLIAAAFVLMVLSPCILVQCSELFRERLRGAKSYSRHMDDPLLLYVQGIRASSRQQAATGQHETAAAASSSQAQARF